MQYLCLITNKAADDSTKLSLSDSTEVRLMVSRGHDIVTPSTHAGHVSPCLSPGKCFTVSPITLCLYLQTVLFPLPLKISKILILGTKPNPLISLFSLPPISNIRKDSAYAGNLCFFLCSLAHSLVLISITEKQNNESSTS